MATAGFVPGRSLSGKGPLLAAVVWLIAVGVGAAALWDYGSAPGEPAEPLSQWPVESTLRADPLRPTLLVVAHPRCPCSRATLDELARLMARARSRTTATVLFVVPEGLGDEWAQSDLWQSARAIPGVEAVIDRGGVQARHFGARTSGQTFLFDAEGRLLFHGGITPSRGHSGDNRGKATILALLDGAGPDEPVTPVFGCHLFAETSCREGTTPCRS